MNGDVRRGSGSPLRPRSLTNLAPLMHNILDQFAKFVTHEGFTPGGHVETDAEVSPDAMRIDVWFTPDPDLPSSTLHHLGLLGRIARSACTIEPFHNPPHGAAVMECLCKHHLFRKQLTQRTPPPTLPTQWILCAGRPSAAIAGLCFHPSAQWGPGIYQGPPLTHTYLIVIGELPETRDTLLVRLMGAGRTLRRAIAGLKALPDDAPERALALPILLRLRLEVAANPRQRTKEDQEFLMSTQDIVEQFLAERRQESLQEGLQKGVIGSLLSVYKARFGQPPGDIVAAIEQTDDLSVLQGWLDLFATRSADEIAAALQAPRQSSRTAPAHASTKKP
jgi:hypothetical protein